MAGMATTMTTAQIKSVADQIEFVWTRFVDEVVIDAAEEAVISLRHLAAVIEGDRG